jgi:hypothetical protein
MSQLSIVDPPFTVTLDTLTVFESFARTGLASTSTNRILLRRGRLAFSLDSVSLFFAQPSTRIGGQSNG